DWIGTRDVTPYLSLIAAISFMDDFGREKIRTHNNSLVKQARAYINSALGVSAVAPESMLGSLATIAIPGNLSITDTKATTLHDTLRDIYHCELPVIFFGDKVYIRISAQIYNEMPEYEHLTTSLQTILSK
ncbi:MAG TPA: aminotransferase, partial [Candidatus Kapabacteria bacterium]